MRLAKREPTPNLSEFLYYLLQSTPFPRSIVPKVQQQLGEGHNRKTGNHLLSPWQRFSGTFRDAGFIIEGPRFLQGPPIPTRGPGAYFGVRVFSLRSWLKNFSGPLASLLETRVSWRNPDSRHKVGWGEGGSTLRPGLLETACRFTVDKASWPRPSNPKSRARAAAPTRAIQTGKGRDSGPGAREKRALCTSGSLDSKEPHRPGSSLKKGSLPYCRFPSAPPHLPEFTANSAAILDAHQRSPVPHESPRKG